EALAVAPQPLAVEQLGASLLERRPRGVRRDGGLELLPRVSVSYKCAAAREQGQAGRGRRAVNQVRIAIESIDGLLGPPTACRRFDQVGHRPLRYQRIRL